MLILFHLFVNSVLLLFFIFPISNSWPGSVLTYRSILSSKTTNITKFSAAALELRQWLIANDPHAPIFHFHAPEGWNNDPNGVIYAPDGLYHRHYQYRPVFSNSTTLPIAWGHSVSKDLIYWEDWPVSMWPDTKWDNRGVFSGNIVIDDDGIPTAIYSGNTKASPCCPYGICARSYDNFLTWNKTACMTKPPNPYSGVNHDTSIWKDGDIWWVLIGGCTADRKGTGWLWSSPDLHNFTLQKSITPGGPGNYWELPYLLPFNNRGDPTTHELASQYALLFGQGGNKYWVGKYNKSSLQFKPFGVNHLSENSISYISSNTQQFSPVGKWLLNNSSGQASVGPNGIISGTITTNPAGIGSLFGKDGKVTIPYFSGIDHPLGFSFSLWLQINSNIKKSSLLGRIGLIWGLEQWEGTVLNFFVRMSASTFRAIQGPFPSTGNWMHVAGSFNSTLVDPKQSIKLFVNGHAIPDKTTEPGTGTGPAQSSTTTGMFIGASDQLPSSNSYISDVCYYAVPMTDSELAAASSGITPPPSPTQPPTPSPTPWPAPKNSDPGSYYSFNPHMTDDKGPHDAPTRRIMFGWVTGPASPTKTVPYWQGAHSIPRLVTAKGQFIVQQPIPEMITLRDIASHVHIGKKIIQPGVTGWLPDSVKGDALEIIAVFKLNLISINADSFGVNVRIGVGESETIFFEPSSYVFGVSSLKKNSDASILGKNTSVSIRIYLDRSILEVYCGGSAITSRLFPTNPREAIGVDLFTKCNNITLSSFDFWRMKSMWTH